NEAARIERIRTASLNYANTASISHMNHTHRQRIPHKLSTTTSRISRPTTPSITQRTFPRIPYDIDDLLVDSTVPSTSLMDAFKKSQATALNTGRVRGNNATSTERKKPRKEYEATIAEKKEQPNMITRK
uniref:Uncharacterized protein n=1 Tax=Parascaris univalens TaxID=6257 RepID=A0A915ALT5_PARUN